MAALTTQQVRDFLSDSASNNHLIDGVEFTDARITLAMELAIDSYNVIPPLTSVNIDDYEGKTVLLYGTCWHLYSGQVALSARNQMSYSDGGLTIPIEERYQFYIQMAQSFRDQFTELAKNEKVAINMESGWNNLHTDYSTFPVW